MKHRLTPINLGLHRHGPLRFGKRWRGHELPLRIVQAILFVVIGIFCARLIADMFAMGVDTLPRLLS